MYIKYVVSILGFNVNNYKKINTPYTFLHVNQKNIELEICN